MIMIRSSSWWVLGIIFCTITGTSYFLFTTVSGGNSSENNHHYETTTNRKKKKNPNSNNNNQILKYQLWQRGEYDFNDSIDSTKLSYLWSKPIKEARRHSSGRNYGFDDYWLMDLRGGSSLSREEDQIQHLTQTLGLEFQQAIEQNRKEHLEDCQTSCQHYYCASDKDEDDVPHNNPVNNSNNNNVTFKSYSMGAVPPEDFSTQFGFPLDLIKVSQQAVISKEEAAQVVEMAESEGLSENEYQSGKYKLGGNWLTELPLTRQWFNTLLKTTLFPLTATLLPEVVSSQKVLRAHSVSLLKYNVTHPRTDVHIDNGILALTLSMNPSNDYIGGGTFFEHMSDGTIEMDVGYVTIRPGSVRHGGAPVTSGQRYILGAFLLIEDKVEHVRRLKNRGSDYRKQGLLDKASQHFEWALKINPKCTTCLKDWAEVLHFQKNYQQAEQKLRQALFFLEYKDSDALFTLGMVLSEQGPDKYDESLRIYQQAYELNPNDAELCYNLGIKLGEVKKDTKGEVEMYRQAVQLDPSRMGGAYINWGTILAEQGDLDGAYDKFLSALTKDTTNSPSVAIKALMNLSLVEQTRSNQYAAIHGNVEKAKEHALSSMNQLNALQDIINGLSNQERNSEELCIHLQKVMPLKLQTRKLLGQIYMGLNEPTKCLEEFRLACQEFSNQIGVWEMFYKVLQRLGQSDTEEAVQVLQTIQMLKALQ